MAWWSERKLHHLNKFLQNFLPIRLAAVWPKERIITKCLCTKSSQPNCQTHELYIIKRIGIEKFLADLWWFGPPSRQIHFKWLEIRLLKFMAVRPKKAWLSLNWADNFNIKVPELGVQPIHSQVSGRPGVSPLLGRIPGLVLQS